MSYKHRVGIGWRPELAAGILANLEKIDAVEVIADEYHEAPASRLRALRTLAVQMPVLLHGTGMGLASTVRADRARLEKMARLIDYVKPESWSEHLAFVRAGGVEIGHLAAAPRNASTVDGTAANLDAARRITGNVPMMENISTLVDPPGGNMGEAEWVGAVLEASGAPLLLDLHNMHVNAFNFGYDAVEFLDLIPWERISTIHIAGGRMLPAGRILDDHLHDVPEDVYVLLRESARRARQRLTVILERDGSYPTMEALLGQMERAREALKDET